ncbi:MAG: TVP38/TMEM64 family protein [Chloroflexota bacterium]|nr:TVP38/TMEM64 family protein [Chloroflexota bacterium]
MDQEPGALEIGTTILGLPRPTRRQAWILLVIALGSVALSFAIDGVLSQFIPLDPASLRDWLDGLGGYAPLIYILLLATAVVVSPIPSVPMDIAAGLAFGLVWGTIYTLIGAEIGALVAFGLARRFGRPWLVRQFQPTTVAQIDRLSDRLGVRGLFLTRLLPVFNFDWVSYAAGLTRMPLRSFAMATLAGMTLPVIGIVAVGDALVTNPSRAALIFGGLLLLVVVPLLWWAIVPARRR